MSASTCPKGYQNIELDLNKVKIFVALLRDLCEGPAEATALLHHCILVIDEINAKGGARLSTAAELGQALTMDILAGGFRES